MEKGRSINVLQKKQRERKKYPKAKVAPEWIWAHEYSGSFSSHETKSNNMHSHTHRHSYWNDGVFKNAPKWLNAGPHPMVLNWSLFPLSWFNRSSSSIFINEIKNWNSTMSSLRSLLLSIHRLILEMTNLVVLLLDNLMSKSFEWGPFIIRLRQYLVVQDALFLPLSISQPHMRGRWGLEDREGLAAPTISFRHILRMSTSLGNFYQIWN